MGNPRLLLASQAKARVDRIQRGLPDALDIVHMCLSGGLPLRDSLARVSKEIEFFHPDIAVEFEVRDTRGPDGIRVRSNDDLPVTFAVFTGVFEDAHTHR